MSAEKFLRQIEAEETAAPSFMKKTAAATAALALGFSLSACSHEKSGSTSPDSNPAAEGEANPGAEEAEDNSTETEVTVESLHINAEMSPQEMGAKIADNLNTWSMYGATAETYNNWDVNKDSFDELCQKTARTNAPLFIDAMIGSELDGNNELQDWVDEKVKNNGAAMCLWMATGGGEDTGIGDETLGKNGADETFWDYTELKGAVQSHRTDDGVELTIPLHLYTSDYSLKEDESDPDAFDRWNFMTDVTVELTEHDDGNMYISSAPVFGDRYDEQAPLMPE